jgi:hypothetical protein
VAREHARGDAVELVVVAVGVHARGIRDAVAVLVFHQAHDLAFDGKLFGAGFAEHRAMQFHTIIDVARREIEFQHSHVAADVEHAAAIPVGFRDEEPSFLVEIDGHRIREHGLRGPEAGLESLRQREALQRQLGVVRGGVDHRIRQAFEGLQFQRLSADRAGAGNEQDSDTGNQEGRFHGLPCSFYSGRTIYG